MVIELRNARALRYGVFAACALLTVFPWMLAIPLWLKIAGSGVALLALAPCTMIPGRQARTLYLEPDGTLSVAVLSREGARSTHKVRSVQVLRFLRHYIEMVLGLDGDRTLRVVVLPGICTPDAMRYLRKFLLRERPKKP